MSEPFVDTEVIIRLLTGDDPVKQAAAVSLFEQMEQGKLILHAPATVIADAVFVLASPRLYHLPHAQVGALLTRLVALPHFHVQNRRTVLRALAIYAASNVDFGDALILAAMEQEASTVIYSYDQDFDCFTGIQRREP